MNSVQWSLYAAMNVAVALFAGRCHVPRHLQELAWLSHGAVEVVLE